MPIAPDLRGRALDGRYELHELVGEGTFGRVYRGFDRRLGRAVAVKVIKPWWAQDPQWLARFEREVRLLAQISHPAIVQIFDVGQGEQGPYWVSELVEGESLAALLRHGALAPGRAAAIARRLCEALAHAHRRGIVHRDLKPANVLLDRAGAVKLGDFGLARLVGGSGEEGTIVGTPRYMAPEQALGRAPTPASDVYGVGVVLYEMLAGRPPFRGGSPVELALRHLREPPPALSSTVPRPLVEVVERALAKRPGERFADAGAMARALAEAQAAMGRADGPGSVAESSAAALEPAGALVGAAARASRPRAQRAGAAARAPEAASMGRRRPLSATRVAPTRSVRRDFNPAGGRRRAALLAAIVALIAVLALGALALAPARRVRVPSLGGARDYALLLARAGLRRGAIRRRYDRAVAAGRVIAQIPRPGARAIEGSAVALTLSAGPPPVQVPPLDGENRLDAQLALRAAGLGSRIAVVPAPGQAAGTVVRQSPAPGAMRPAGSTVTLSVAQAPRWRQLDSLAGAGGAVTAPLLVLGDRLRIVYSLRFGDDCSFWFLSFCSGPTVSLVEQDSGRAVARVQLGAGSRQTQAIQAPPGRYRLLLSPGGDPASWSLALQDYY